MKESWHLTAPKPPMVRYTTKDYSIGHHSSPFEEIDDVADTLFNLKAFGSSLHTGRVVKQPTKRKAKGRGLPGASIRDPTESTRRDNWLTSLVPPVAIEEHREPSPAAPQPVDIKADTIIHAEPTSAEVLPSETLQSSTDHSSGDLTQLEQLFAQFGANALSDHHPPTNTAPSQEQVEQVFRRALLGIRAVIAKALEQGYYPVDSDLKEPEALEAETVVPHPGQVVEPSGHKSSHNKKRKKEQSASIRLFNKPVERSKKKRKTDAVITSTAEPSILLEAADRPRKQKITTFVSFGSALKAKPAKQQTSRSDAFAASSPTPLPLHASGSTTLEPHQHLPPDAYFTPQSPEEKPVWRCGIRHALGHYYNAGDRRNCPGCFTALSDNTSAATMDFYLPSRSHYHQPNPTTSWRPSKPFGTTYNRTRRSKHLSHNSIAKEAYWSAIAVGSSPDDARQTAIAAVMTHLAPKPPPKEPTPAPTPTPEPDPGPHPSGSATMEHTQDIPSCAYFSQKERHEELAWRCDVNHALGRYYLAGDKRSCPGCGSNKGGLARHAVMDFYLPLGVVVASRKYWGAIDAGRSPEDALIWAVRETDRWLDEREHEAVRRAEEREAAKQTKGKTVKMSNEDGAMTASTPLNAARQRNARSASDCDEHTDEAGRDETDDEMHDTLVAAFEEQPSSDESSSESDSE
ncbi:hypothetical protein E8E11_006614 [Didymella keratinophila]|nr:hypothetical protein E8E11_006614 [Didymella keratinophila]